MKRVYLDHNSTTFVRREARAVWLEVVDQRCGNPSSPHAAGRRARHRIDLARERVAAALGVAEDEVLFTSGGTEANNAALLGALRAPGARPGLVTTSVEHSSVLGAAERLEAAGHPVYRLPVDAVGRPRLEALAALLARGSVGLVSAMAANNEVGSLTDLPALRALLDALPAAERPLLHVDAVQALGRLPLDLGGWGADLASFSAHKVGGPPGVGVLVRRRGVELEPLVIGGGQEQGLRAGTEDAAGIAAAAVAIELAVHEQPITGEHVAGLARRFFLEVVDRLPDVRLLGPSLEEPRLPGTLNLAFPGSDGKVLVTQLDLEGLELSAGSACASGSIEPSHVLRAMGLDEDDARAGVRVSFGRSNDASDCTRAVEILTKVFSRSRAT